MGYQEERDLFMMVMAEEKVDYYDVKLLLRDAQRIQTHAVVMCNTTPTKAQDRRAEKAGERIVALMKKYEIKVDLGGDSRGACVKLGLKSKRYNTWGGGQSGWAVPTRDR